MITTYKVKLIEGEKSLKQEIELVGDNKEEIILETTEIYLKLKPFCLKESITKTGLGGKIIC